MQNLERDGRVRVWLWSIVGVDNDTRLYGTDLDGFMKTVRKLHCQRVFFHNLKFDGHFIVDWFMRKGMVQGTDYETIIDGLGSWYEIKWKMDSRHTVRFWDSLKKFPGTSVRQLGRFIGLPKLDAPFFDRYYPSDYTPTEQEVAYCIRDSEVVAEAMKYELEQGFKSMTLASDCFKFGRDKCLNGRFYRDFFPLLSPVADGFCRKAYRGGISYLKPEYVDTELHGIKVYDVNSLYPWVMHDCMLPYGYAVYSEGDPVDDLYFVRFKTRFYLKNDRFPFLQLKNSPRYGANEFVECSNGVEELTLTSVDYDNFKKNYKVIEEYDHEYLSFKGMTGLMAPHVDHWMERKKYYEAQGMPFMRYIAKTFMNGFYGKTATRLERENVQPFFDAENDKVSYSKKVKSTVEPIYIPYGAFVTAWARDKLINSALSVWDRFVYCDTDSIHCFDGPKVPLDVHPTDLGKWKDETADGAYEYARYIKQKTYCHARPAYRDGVEYKEIVEIKAAGLNLEARTGIPFDDFRYGLTVKNANLKQRTVPGGAVLQPMDWRLDYDERQYVSEFFEETGGING